VMWDAREGRNQFASFLKEVVSEVSV
jgi:hypothetical protein